MPDRRVSLIKPDGSVGYEFHVGLLQDSEFDVEARKAALEERAGTQEEITSWTLMAPASPQDHEKGQ